MHFTTLIRARTPRSDCPEHGVKTVRTPWAEPGAHWTLRFEAHAVELILACRSLTQVAELLQMDWDGVQRLVAAEPEHRMLLAQPDEAPQPA